MKTVQQNGRFTLFLVNSTLVYILFSLVLNQIRIVQLLKEIYTKPISKCGLPLLFLQNLRRDQTFKNVFFVSNYRRTHKTIENEDDIQAILF